MTATRGLEGVVATTSSVSSIIDDTLTYVGYDIDDLTENASFEEIIYLLWHLRLPNKKELEELKQQLAKEAAVPQEIIEHFKSYSLENVHPMAALRTAISLLGLLDSEADTMNPEANYRKAIRLQAKVPGLVAAFSRIRKGLEPVEPREDYGIAENFLYTLNGEEPSPIEV
ncbi:citrate/2-methylcitrate synthase, partial [Bacillus sp. LR--39]